MTIKKNHLKQHKHTQQQDVNDIQNKLLFWFFGMLSLISIWISWNDFKKLNYRLGTVDNF